MDKLIINSDLRTIYSPNVVVGVFSDHNVNRLTFSCPRFYDGLDLSTFDVYINYVNALGEGSVYRCDDVSAPDFQYIEFSWLISNYVTKKEGKIKFSVCMKDHNEENEVVHEFNTIPVIGIVKPGLETSTVVIESQIDILKQWEEILNKIPYIGENGHWYIYNVEEKRYEDSGVSAGGGEGSLNFTEEDEGKFLTIKDGELVWATVPTEEDLQILQQAVIHNAHQIEELRQLNQNYLTVEEADKRYLTQATLDGFLTQEEAEGIFLTQENAENVYLTKNDANNTFLTEENANSIFMTQDVANNTFITQETANSTFITKESAGDIFITEKEVSEKYVTKEELDELEIIIASLDGGEL